MNDILPRRFQVGCSLPDGSLKRRGIMQQVILVALGHQDIAQSSQQLATMDGLLKKICRPQFKGLQFYFVVNGRSKNNHSRPRQRRISTDLLEKFPNR